MSLASTLREHIDDFVDEGGVAEKGSYERQRLAIAKNGSDEGAEEQIDAVELRNET